MPDVDYFLSLDGIKGESKDTNYKDQIPLLSWSHGGEQSSSMHTGTGGHGAGKVTMHPLTLTKPVDKSSVPLLKALAVGTHIQKGKLSAVKAGANRKPYYTIDLTTAFVSSYVISAVDQHPVESITLSYEQIKIEYFLQDDKGTVASGGSVTINTSTNAVS